MHTHDLRIYEIMNVNLRHFGTKNYTLFSLGWEVGCLNLLKLQCIAT